MPRTPNRKVVKLETRGGVKGSCELTPRQLSLFEILKEREGKPVIVAEIMARMGVSLANVRVLKNEVASMITPFYTIDTKWNEGYTLRQM